MITFLSPFLIWGALLGAIPLIIHLLNRRRFRRVEWAPMHYLKLTIQRNRQADSARAASALVVADRPAGVVVLLPGAAGLNPTGLEQWLGTGGRSSQVVLIDDSLSMGYAAGEASAFQRALQSAAGLLAAIRPEDHCTVVTTSSPRAPVIHDVEGSRRDEIAAAVASVPLTATHAAWPAVLEGVDEVLRSCTYPTRQLTIVTDLRKSGWDAGIEAIAAAGASSRRSRAGRRCRQRRGRQCLAPVADRH